MTTQTPTGAEIAKLRNRLGLTQKALATLFGVTLATWQKKESETSKETIGIRPAEFQFLLLLADEHPQYVLTQKQPELMTVQNKPSADDVRQMREAAGLSVEQAATLFECLPRSWQSKENPNTRGTLTVGEYNYLLLLAGKHPYLSI
jgi:DNA-binding transcriptional regulator YiaG